MSRITPETAATSSGGDDESLRLLAQALDADVDEILSVNDERNGPVGGIFGPEEYINLQNWNTAISAVGEEARGRDGVLTRLLAVAEAAREDHFAEKGNDGTSGSDEEELELGPDEQAIIAEMQARLDRGEIQNPSDFKWELNSVIVGTIIDRVVAQYNENPSTDELARMRFYLPAWMFELAQARIEAEKENDPLRAREIEEAAWHRAEQWRHVEVMYPKRAQGWALMASEDPAEVRAGLGLLDEFDIHARRKDEHIARAAELERKTRGTELNADPIKAVRALVHRGLKAWIERERSQ